MVHRTRCVPLVLVDHRPWIACPRALLPRRSPPALPRVVQCVVLPHVRAGELVVLLAPYVPAHLGLVRRELTLEVPWVKRVFANPRSVQRSTWHCAGHSFP